MNNRSQRGATQTSTALWLSVVVVALVIVGVFVVVATTGGDDTSADDGPPSSRDAKGTTASTSSTPSTSTTSSSSSTTPSTETPQMNYQYDDRGQRAAHARVIGNPWPKGATTEHMNLSDLPAFDAPAGWGCLWRGKSDPYPPHFTCINERNHRIDKFQSTVIISLVHCKACSDWTTKKVVTDRTQWIDPIKKGQPYVTGSFIDRASDRSGDGKVQLVAGIPLDTKSLDRRILLVWASATPKELADLQHMTDSLMQGAIKEYRG